MRAGGPSTGALNERHSDLLHMRMSQRTRNVGSLIRPHTEVFAMRPLVIAVLLLLTSPLALSRTINSCDAESAFDLTLHPNRLELTREDDRPRRVELVDGRLWLDNREQQLSAGDRARLLRFEAEVRALAPRVRTVALEGVAIAVDAIGMVIAHLGGDSARLDQLQRELLQHGREWEQRIRSAQSTRDWGTDEDAAFAGKLIAQMAPAIAAEMAAGAVRAALSGDEAKLAAIEKRAAGLEQEIERRVEARADKLELAARALCPSIRELDRIDNALAIRTTGNKPLNLIEIGKD